MESYFPVEFGAEEVTDAPDEVTENPDEVTENPEEVTVKPTNGINVINRK